MTFPTSIENVSECFGCTSCTRACPHGAIRLEPDALGFQKAKINSATCVRCGICATVCPAIHKAPAFAPLRAVCGWNRDPAVRSTSSSGGLFAALASFVIARGGVVFGAIFDAMSKSVRHDSSDKVSMSSICGSKYVQSEVGDTFRIVKSEIGKGREVLFCGTPCQVAGLVRFLRSPSNRLLTVDFICHGAGSPSVFGACLDRRVGERGGVPVESLSFRDKTCGWRNSSTCIKFQDGGTYRRRNIFDPFFQGFVDGCFFNSTCYDCPFDNTSAADIRLSDFWGHAGLVDVPDADKGLSLAFANTKVGATKLAELSATCELLEIPVQAAIASQKHSREQRQNLLPRRKRFLDQVSSRGIMAALERNIGWTIAGIVMHKIRRIGVTSAVRRFVHRLVLCR